MPYNEQTKMWDGFVYLIENKLNGKKYVGQTRKTLSRRFIEHANNGSKSQCPIDVAMRKYGKGNFKLSELKHIACPTVDELSSELNKWEQYYIEKLNTYKGEGYNATFGGAGYTRIGHRVDVYTLDGTYLESFDSIQVAADKYQAPPSSIRKVCEGEYRYSNDYVFRYANEPFDKHSLVHPQYKPVDVYNIHGEFLNTFPSIAEAAKKYNVLISHAHGCCNGSPHVLRKKYVFRYHGDAFDSYIVEYTDKKAVVEYNYFGEKVARYESIKAAAIAHNTTPIFISEICNGIKSTAFGKTFRFENDSFEKYQTVFPQCWQFDLNKNFIKEYPSNGVASRATNTCLTGIQKCINGKQKTANGFIWTKAGVYP